jgi:hypothetical protein
VEALPRRQTGRMKQEGIGVADQVVARPAQAAQ